MSKRLNLLLVGEAMTNDELNERWRSTVVAELLAVAREFGYDEMMRRARFVAGTMSVLAVGDEVLAIADDLFLTNAVASLR
jgi:hypothetical protein